MLNDYLYILEYNQKNMNRNNYLYYFHDIITTYFLSCFKFITLINKIRVAIINYIFNNTLFNWCNKYC